MKLTLQDYVIACCLVSLERLTCKFIPNAIMQCDVYRSGRVCGISAIGAGAGRSLYTSNVGRRPSQFCVQHGAACMLIPTFVYCR